MSMSSENKATSTATTAPRTSPTPAKVPAAGAPVAAQGPGYGAILLRNQLKGN
jgi:hypothetical protein